MAVRNLHDRCTSLGRRPVTEPVYARDGLPREPTLVALAALLAVTFHAAAVAQPCNPVIDGTYCATQMPQSGSSSRSTVNIPPVQSIGGDVLGSQERPATCGAITFQGGGTQCIGLLRRGRCF
jgi:hypothetical protein